ncbi:MAG: hydantoinase/carbamoylase family amidase [Selenomonas sp.]|uniref:hydantoinase/carbamoylase family amidase n=1 Tax=Selenomonas sp. TaxID=2053611 RepID=UPI0025F548BD|nr:hydantoinase/carbamoylase family amidase [Selenomonas sp.]MCR5757466.1 hydantoinase/carbamoylase family amidase [Selenomonas sp.]
MNDKLKINRARLLSRLDALGEIGRNSAGGIDRQLGSEADEKGRLWLRKCWQEELGLQVIADGIANLWGMQPSPSSSKPILLGSHHDTVPNGGKYDGALGVLMATEILQTLQEQQVKLQHPLQLISFTGEEPNDFSVSTLGSKVLCGRLDAEQVSRMRHRRTGETLPQALARLGGNIQEVDAARLAPNRIAAFLECHIEQGRILDEKRQAIAPVSCITGIYREIITVCGESNHAGTTHYKDRQDALAAAAEIILAAETIMTKFDPAEIAATVGRLKVVPNASNIVPGKVMLSLDLRTANPRLRQQALAFWQEELANIQSRRSIKIQRELNLDQQEMPMDAEVIQALQDAAESTVQGTEPLVSMAGHDAANMARLTKSGMLFVRTTEGYSHCPRETAPDDAIEIAANTLLQAVLLLDRRLDADA